MLGTSGWIPNKYANTPWNNKETDTSLDYNAISPTIHDSMEDEALMHMPGMESFRLDEAFVKCPIEEKCSSGEDNENTEELCVLQHFRNAAREFVRQENRLTIRKQGVVLLRYQMAYERHKYLHKCGFALESAQAVLDCLDICNADVLLGHHFTRIRHYRDELVKDQQEVTNQVRKLEALESSLVEAESQLQCNSNEAIRAAETAANALFLLHEDGLGRSFTTEPESRAHSRPDCS